MPDPVFTSADRVDTPPSNGLPAELAGKTPAEIAAHYQARERAIVANAQNAIAANAANGNTPPRHQTPAVTAEDFERDPLGATQRIVSENTVSRQEFNQLTTAAQGNMIESAKFQASQGKKYWTRLLPIIDQMAAGADAIAKLDSSFWTTVYQAALGQMYDTIQSEERAAAAAASASAEPPSGGSTPPPIPRMLTEKEVRICEGLDLTHDQFRKGEELMRTNTFPVTLDNRRR